MIPKLQRSLPRCFLPSPFGADQNTFKESKVSVIRLLSESLENFSCSDKVYVIHEDSRRVARLPLSKSKLSSPSPRKMITVNLACASHFFFPVQGSNGCLNSSRLPVSAGVEGHSESSKWGCRGVELVHTFLTFQSRILKAASEDPLGWSCRGQCPWATQGPGETQTPSDAFETSGLWPQPHPSVLVPRSLTRFGLLSALGDLPPPCSSPSPNAPLPA